MIKNRISSEVIYKTALWLSLIFIPIIVLFFWQESLETDRVINSDKFGTFGDFIGGVLGSMWSLCGILLFYNALKEQREDFRTNKEALSKQVEALTVQSNEFKLQREELRSSRNIFQEQAQILRQQRLETLFFSMLELYGKIKSDLNNNINEKNYFKQFKNDLTIDIEVKKDCTEKFFLVIKKYEEQYYQKKEELSHYFKLVYRIIKIIDDAEIKPNEKFRYIKIFRSQLSENEMLAIFYNSHTVFGRQFYTIILRYNLLKHLPSISKIEFLPYQKIFNNLNSISSNNAKTQLILFNNEITDIIKNFLSLLKIEVLTDEYEQTQLSASLKTIPEIIYSIESNDVNKLEMTLANKTRTELGSILALTKESFIWYLKSYLLDLFIFSQYIDYENVNVIDASEKNELIIVNLDLKKRISLSNDME